MARASLLSLAVCALALVACSDDYGEPCDLPQTGAISVFCEPSSDEDGATSATCVFTNSTECESRMCARYIGSEGFCTIECDPEAEAPCPGTSTCQTVPATDIAFCVPEKFVEVSQ